MRSFQNSILKKPLLLLFKRLTPLMEEARKHYSRDLVGEFKACGANVSLGDSPLIHGHQYISIGDNFHAGRLLRIEAIASYEDQQFSPLIEIGNNVSCEDFCHIGGVNSIRIGDGTMIASRVFITDHFHGTVSSNDFEFAPAKRPLSFQQIVIGKNVLIGEGVSIMPGVEIGDNVIIGANAVVTHSFPSKVVIAGCPARVIKSL